MADMSAELRALFREEATEGLDHFARALEGMHGRDASAVEHVDAAFRVMHNIKGAARLAGIPLIEAVAHAIEDALSTLRERRAVPSAELLSELRSGAALIAHLLGGDEPVAEVAQFLKTFAAQVSAALAPPGAAREGAHAAVDSQSEASDAREAPAQEAVVEHEPSKEQELSPQIAKVLAQDGGQSTLRIEAARLDRLMHFASELMVTEGRFRARHEALDSCHRAMVQIARSLGTAERQALRNVERELAELVQADRQDVQRFGYLVSDWSRAIKSARMLPLSSAIAHWRRTVSEAAHVLGRDVQLHTDVHEIEIDRQILDGLRDPFVHLLRNAVDHGIERPDDRVRAGKSRVGTIRIEARATGTMIELDVTDDGRGLDPGAIGRRAVERGLVDAAKLARMSRHEILDLVFAPGFSTAESVSHFSGRGVGLDVVRRRVNELGGHARVAETSRGGAAFRLEVPATVVSTRGLLVRTFHTAYALPTAYVVRTLRVPSSAVHKLDGGAAIHEDGGEPIRLRWLASLMQEPRDADRDKLLVVVVSDGNVRVGLVVQDIVGEVEFVVKPMPWNIPRTPGVSGAMILGNGSVALVVDVPRLVGSVALVEGRGETVHVAEAVRARRVLVVDDSLTSRTLERNILTAAGYEVETAVDGEAGWQALQSGSFDLVVSDVQMPKLDGLGLTKRIRAHMKLKSIPIILVTSLDSPSDIAHGAAAGADEYVVKGRFDQTTLLEAVARLL